MQTLRSTLERPVERPYGNIGENRRGQKVHIYPSQPLAKQFVSVEKGQYLAKLDGRCLR